MHSEISKYLQENIKRKIVIYGSRDNCEDALEGLRDIYDVYYMQPGMEGEGYLSLDQAAQLRIDYIMLADPMNFMQEGFQRLLAFCNRMNLPLLDAKGRRIDLICNNAAEYAYLSKEKMLHEIENHTHISFDIFDTLLIRKTLSPEDIWKLVEERAQKSGHTVEDFASKRVAAQDELGLSNPDINDIYDNLCKKYQILEETAELYKELEIRTEREMLTVRQDMVDLFHKSLESGKSVYLVSDMYLPESVIREILEEKGVTGYKAIYISCDRKLLKLQGLFELYKEQQGQGTFLHIGDHTFYDGVCAALAGMDYCLVPSPLAMAKGTLLVNAVDNAASVSERLLLGAVISRVMNSPFKAGWQKNTLEIDTEYEYGYAFCAALIVMFTLWMASVLSRGNYEKVLFASRDGYVLKKMYEIICDSDDRNCLPGSIYFYTSRKAAVMTNIKNEAYINMIIDISGDMRPESIMRERFGLRQDEIKEYDEAIYGDSIHKYVWEHVESIFKRADEAKNNYFRYMGKAGLEIGRKYAFIDFVSSGTTQKSLMRIAPFDLEGIYMGWNGMENKEEAKVNALFDGGASYFMSHYKMVETFMSSQEPSLTCFDDKGDPVFSAQDRNVKELAYVDSMQAACIDLLRELLAIQNWEEIHIREEFADLLLAAEGCAEIAADSVLHELALMDDWKQEKSLVEELIK